MDHVLSGRGGFPKEFVGVGCACPAEKRDSGTAGAGAGRRPEQPYKAGRPGRNGKNDRETKATMHKRGFGQASRAALFK